jgi:hypothetical protein
MSTPGFLRVPLLLAIALLGLATPVAHAQGVAAPGGRGAVTVIDGSDATVLLFTAVDCPIANRYAPELVRLASTFGDRVRFTLVYPNHGDTAAAIERHARVFGYRMPHVRDADGSLVGQAGVTVTPEVAVFDRGGRLAYRGRIDDRYADFGVDRPTPTRRDLAIALEETLAGRTVSVPETRAIGCAIVRRP